MNEGRKAIVDQIEDGLRLMRNAAEGEGGHGHLPTGGAEAQLEDWRLRNDTRQTGRGYWGVLGHLLSQLNPGDVLTIRQ